MDILSNSFEKFWARIFLSFYFFILIPFPCFFSEQYIPGFWGVPTYILWWLVYAIVVLVLIIIFSYKCLSQECYKLPLSDSSESLKP